MVSPKFAGQRILTSSSGKIEVEAITNTISRWLNRLPRNDFCNPRFAISTSRKFSPLPESTATTGSNRYSDRPTKAFSASLSGRPSRNNCIRAVQSSATQNSGRNPTIPQLFVMPIAYTSTARVSHRVL